MKRLGVYDILSDLENVSGAWGRIAYLNPRAIVTAVYDGEYDTADSDEDEKKGAFSLLPGQVEINTSSVLPNKDIIVNTLRRIAWVIMPYGMRVDMEEDQQASIRVERTSNQHYGMYSMPRVGDTVFVIGFDFSSGIIEDIHYFVLGVMSSEGVTRPPPVDKEDMQFIHRSGASIRLNDTYAAGGGITTTTVPAMKDLTGNLTMVGNRTMILAGRKYLSHGQLAKYGDTREPFVNLKIQTFTEDVGDDTYSELFTNTSGEVYYDPFASANIGTSHKFLSPPSTTDSIIPLTDNTLLLSQHGGGVIRIDDHSDNREYSRMTMASASMSIMIGEEYQDLGRAGDSASVESAAGIGGDGNAGMAGDVGTVTDTFEIQHKSGTRVTIDEDGTINLYTRDPNATIHIDTQDDARIYIGDGDHPIVRSEDTTQKERATAAIMGPPGTLLGNLGIPAMHQHDGHTHVELHTQEKTWV
jgi:hypothetical protein